VRVHVISDMEGVSGVVKWEQVSGGEPMFEEGRRLYTEEINAAVRGARAAGATEIVVMDCHGAGKGWTFNSLIPEELDPDCEWVVQNEWTEYTEFLEGGCDAALFVAMHAKAGTPDGVLSHTVSGNPNRFETGAIELRPDHEWISNMSPRDRALVTVLTSPLLYRYGYRIAASSQESAVS
jgi:D-aminopeptidase